MKKSILVLLLLFCVKLTIAQSVVDFSMKLSDGTDVTSGCAPMTIVFKDLSTGVSSRTWNLGEGIISKTDAEVGKNFLVDGTYTITLTVNFTNGTTSSLSKTIIVHPKPVADFKGDELAGCKPHKVNFTSLSTTKTGTITDYLWNFGSAGSTSAAPSYTFTTNGKYKVTLMVTNNWGCQSEAATKIDYIEVYDRPKASFTVTNKSSCSLPFTTSFTNTTTGGGQIKYSWNFGDGSPASTDPNPSHTYTTPGLYTVTLTASNGTYCTDVYTGSNIISVGTPSATITATDKACSNTNVPFTANVSIPAFANTIKWTFPGGVIKYGSYVTNSFPTAGNQTVTLEVINTAGCSSGPINYPIEIVESPKVTFNADKTFSCTPPLDVNFTSTIIPSGSYIYKWNFGDGSASGTTSNPSHTYTTGNTNYSVSLIVTDQTTGCSTTVSQPGLIAIQQPTVSLYISNKSGCAPFSISPTAYASNVTGTVDSYIWNWGDGTPNTSTSTNSTSHTYAMGNYNATVTIITSKGCEATSAPVPIEAKDCSGDGGGGGGGGNGGSGLDGGGKSTCADPYTFTFKDTVTVVPGSSVIWDFGDGSTTVTTPAKTTTSHTYAPPPGKYYITITRQEIVKGVATAVTRKDSVTVIDEKANFTAGITDICIDKTVQFTTVGITPANIKKYTWDFGDGSNKYGINNNGGSNNGNTSHMYNKGNGSFNVTLEIIDMNGCTNTYQLPVPINVHGPVPGFSANVLTSCAESFEVTFTDTSRQNGSTPIEKWEWNFGDGATYTTTDPSAVIKHTYTNTSYYRFYTVSLKVTDAAGCYKTATYTNYIKSYRPKASFYSYNTLQCGNYKVQLYSNSSVYNAKKYTWDFGDGSTPLEGTNAYPQYTYSTEGEYTITLKVEDENGCTDVSTSAAYIKIVKPKADFTTSDLDKCAPVAVSFSDASTYASAWEWDFGDNTFSNEQYPYSHIYDNPGDYDVKLKITGTSGCTDEITKHIHIKGPVGTLNNGNTIGCAPFNFKAWVTGSNIKAYTWDVGDGTLPDNLSQTNTLEYIYQDAGKFVPNVILTAIDGCKLTKKLADTVIVDDAKAGFSITKNILCDEATVSFTNTSKVPSFSSVQSYSWNFGDGSSIDNNATPLPYHYTQAGIYNISLAIQSQYGCKDTSLLKNALIIPASPKIQISGADIICLDKGTPALQYQSVPGNTVPIATYKWFIDNIQISSSQHLQYDYRQPGTKQLKLIVFTADGCSDTAVKNIIIDSVSANFSINNPIGCGIGSTIYFTNNTTSASPIDKYVWLFSDDNSTSGQKDPTHIYNITGKHTVTLQTETINGCKSAITKTDSVIIFTKPVVTISGSNKGCEKDELSFSASASSQDEIVDQYWELNGVKVGNKNSFSNIFTQAGTYQLKFTIATKYGCIESATTSIVINPLPKSATIDDTVICKGDKIQLYATDGTTYNWKSIDNTIENPNSATPSVSPSTNTWYYITITNQFGCVQKDSVLVSLNERIGLTVSPDVTICEGDRTRLKATGNTKTFQWTPVESLNKSNISNPWASPAQTTTYSVLAKSENVCPDEQKNITVTVAPNPTVSFTESLTLEAGVRIVLQPVLSNNIAQYNWTPSSGLSCNNCARPELIADKDTKYTLKVTTSDGCVASADIEIRVVCGKGAVYIPNAFTPNGDGNNDVFYIKGYGVQQIKSFRIFTRWGDVVYQRENISANDKNAGWDGKVKGVPVNQTTTYVYIAEVICQEGKLLQFKGTVTLVK